MLLQVWWSPCRSRECPDSEEIDIVVDQCLDHCLLLEQNPKIEIIAPPTKAPMMRPPTEDNGDIDDLNFHLSKRKHKDAAKLHPNGTTILTTTSTTEMPSKFDTFIIQILIQLKDVSIQFEHIFS